MSCKMFEKFTRNHLCRGSFLKVEVNFFLWVFWNFQNYLGQIKSFSKGDVKSRDFIDRQILSTFLCLEWIKSSPRTTLIQNTTEYVLLEENAMQKIKKVPRVKNNIFIFIFSCQGTMKQTVKHSVSIEKETFVSSSSSPLSMEL